MRRIPFVSIAEKGYEKGKGQLYLYVVYKKWESWELWEFNVPVSVVEV